MSASTTFTLALPTDHPVFAGHFPSHPIVPGALILDEVVRLFESRTGITGCVVRTAKFSHPALPGQTLDIELIPSARESVNFRVTTGDTLIASGTIGAD